ncbi:MAG: hypothetical protein DRQ55_12655 [Planctomycetota bacterium]|nr:MAG: hypothetical protein DRQ55_12655 [Planctomycetota bacterium]
MSRLARRFIVCTFALALLGGGKAGLGPGCTIELARAMYGPQADFAIFFDYIFNIPGKSGALGSAFSK